MKAVKKEQTSRAWSDSSVEAAVDRCFLKEVFSKFMEYSQENTMLKSLFNNVLEELREVNTKARKVKI